MGRTNRTEARPSQAKCRRTFVEMVQRTAFVDSINRRDQCTPDSALLMMSAASAVLQRVETLTREFLQ